jgi:hypothetical protein
MEHAAAVAVPAVDDRESRRCSRMSPSTEPLVAADARGRPTWFTDVQIDFGKPR